MKKAIFILFLLTAVYSFSEEKDSESDLSHYIGGAAGITTGYGLSYRHWGDDLGFQVVFTPMTGYNLNILINLGTGIFKTLYETTYTRLFLYGAANATYTNQNLMIYDQTGTQNINTLEFAAGFGPGIELYLFKNIVIDLMFGYKYGFGSGLYGGLGFTAEAGIYYRF